MFFKYHARCNMCHFHFKISLSSIMQYAGSSTVSDGSVDGSLTRLQYHIEELEGKVEALQMEFDRTKHKYARRDQLSYLEDKLMQYMKAEIDAKVNNILKRSSTSQRKRSKQKKRNRT